MTFQFHKGTIKTELVSIQKYPNTDFNSIKVRLKPSTKLYRCSKLLFQFHKGTIKTAKFYNSSCLLRTFQFHKGTIKTL